MCDSEASFAPVLSFEKKEKKISLSIPDWVNAIYM